MTDPKQIGSEQTDAKQIGPEQTAPDPIGPEHVSAQQIDPDQMTFEQLVSTLEELTDRLASGQIGIEEAAELYEDAERLHGWATERLARVQARIDALASPFPPSAG